MTENIKNEVIKYHSKIVGVTFEGRQAILAKLSGSEPLRVRREADNEYDGNAVAVDAYLSGKGIPRPQWKPVGYIAKDKNKDIAETLDSGMGVFVKIGGLTGGGDKSYGMNIYLEYSKPAKEQTKETPSVSRGDVKNVLEYLLSAIDSRPIEQPITTKYHSVLLNKAVELSVDPLGHKSLEGYISGSRFPEQFYPEFDEDSILDAIKNKYDVDIEKVKSMWCINKDVSTSYGRAIHLAMENYDKNKILGDKIKSVKKYKTKADVVGPNKALSRNPFIKRVVESFHEAFGDDLPVLSEEFVFSKEFKLCGTIDRVKVIDPKKKIVRIQDYKTDGDIHEKKYQKTDSPFKSKLGNELLDLHWLQLSFYAFILEQAGFKVQGLDVYWLNPEKLVNGEQPWEEYSHKVVDISEAIIGV